MKVLVATEKPFAKVAVDGIREVVEHAGYELVLLEKYTAKQQLLDAVVDADALIIRSDNVDAEVLDAQAHGGILLSELSLLPISSSAIRAQVKRSESPQFLLPDAVWAYMVEHRLYQDIE